MKTAKLKVLSLLLLFIASCSDEKIDFNAGDSVNVASEAQADAVFSDSEDLASITVSSDNATSGGRLSAGARIIAVNDPRLACATVTITPDNNSTILIPKGILTVDFGSACTDNQGNTRSGKIKIAYHGRRFLPASSVVTTFDGYGINGIKVEGIRTITNAATSSQADPKFTTTMQAGKITWPDGTIALRDEVTTREWKLGAVPADNMWWVTGSASGTNRAGIDYSMSIVEQLVYKRACLGGGAVFVAVQGKQELIVNSKKIDIDYGTGVCDKLVTITIKSKSKEIELKGGN